MIHCTLLVCLLRWSHPSGSGACPAGRVAFPTLFEGCLERRHKIGAFGARIFKKSAWRCLPAIEDGLVACEQLADVHAVIAYYLRHRDEVRAYLARRAGEAEALRAKIEAERPRVGRDELLARRRAREKDHAPTGQ